MTDITKCANQHCPLRAKCHRATARDDPDNQSWAMFAPEDDGVCNDLWGNGDGGVGSGDGTELKRRMSTKEYWETNHAWGQRQWDS